MVLDWMVREQQTPGRVSQELQGALQQLEQARRSGRELRFYKEKTEILSTALSQAYGSHHQQQQHDDQQHHHHQAQMGYCSPTGSMGRRSQDYTQLNQQIEYCSPSPYNTQYQQQQQQVDYCSPSSFSEDRWSQAETLPHYSRHSSHASHQHQQQNQQMDHCSPSSQQQQLQQQMDYCSPRSRCEDRWSQAETLPEYSRHHQRQPSQESTLTDQSYDFYSQESVNDRESLG